MRRFFIISLASGFLFAILFGLGIAIEKAHHFETEMDFVILSDKVGNPVFMTAFRVNPEEQEIKDPNYCQVGGDKLYTPTNVSVFNESEIGDILRRYHYTNSYQVFGKILYQNCYDVFMPLRVASLYPDMGRWPFRKGDLNEKDINYHNVMKYIPARQ